MSISNFAVTDHGGFCSEDSSWEDTEPTPLPQMVKECKLLSHKKSKLYAGGKRGKSNRGGRGCGGTAPII